MSYGKTATQEEFEEDMEANIKTLSNNIDLLEDLEDRSFARSLCDWYDRYSSLSQKQSFRASEFWATVNSLGAKQATSSSQGTPIKATGASDPAEVLPPVVKIDGSKLIAAFDKAAEKLQNPRIVYNCGDPNYGVDKIVLRRGTGKYHGCISISNGEKYPIGILLGTISRVGAFTFATFCLSRPYLQQFLKQLIENYVDMLAINGKKSGHCCFCGLTLTNPESVARGYGPICAENYGLPWNGSDLPKHFNLDI